MNRIQCLVGMMALALGCGPSLPTLSQMRDAEWEHKEATAFNQLIPFLEEIGASLPTTREYWEPAPFQYRNEEGEIVRDVRLLTYGVIDSSRCEVKLTFYPTDGGLLKTQLDDDAPYVPKRAKIGKTSTTYYLVITERGDDGIDAIPDAVEVDELILTPITKKTSRVSYSTTEHTAYQRDPRVRSEIDRMYRMALHARLRQRHALYPK